MNCKFSDVSERDMDLLFLEEFASSPDFSRMFLSKIGKIGAEVLEVEHSKTDSEFGESDMTVIFQCGEKKHALLIEDKIDATAMPRQCERYFKRGERGVERDEYESFDVFIVAPQKYLEENEEAALYPYQVSYEECLTYFEEQEDARSRFKAERIAQAIHKQKHGYQLIENAQVTAFWEKYISFQETYYPELPLTSKRGKKGFWARWAYFRTVIENVLIYHKTEYGYMDMTFEGAAEKIVLFEKTMLAEGFHLKEKGIRFEKTGKSAALRMIVPKMDFTKPFEEYEKDMSACFEAAAVLVDLAKEISMKENLVAFAKTRRKA